MSPIGFAEVDLKISSVVISLQSVLMQLISRYLALVIQSGGKSSLGNNGRVKRMREGYFGAAVSAPPAQRRWTTQRRVVSAPDTSAQVPNLFLFFEL